MNRLIAQFIHSVNHNSLAEKVGLLVQRGQRVQPFKLASEECNNYLIQKRMESSNKKFKQDGSLELGSAEDPKKYLNSVTNISCGAANEIYRTDLQVSVRLVGLIIGKGGETIKRINNETGAAVCLSKLQYSKNRRIVTITGTEDRCLIAKYEVEKVIVKGLNNLQNSGGLTQDEVQMLSPLPNPTQLQNMNIPFPLATLQQHLNVQHLDTHTLQSQFPSLYSQVSGTQKGQEMKKVEQTKKS